MGAVPRGEEKYNRERRTIAEITCQARKHQQTDQLAGTKRLPVSRNQRVPGFRVSEN